MKKKETKVEVKVEKVVPVSDDVVKIVKSDDIVVQKCDVAVE